MADHRPTEWNDRERGRMLIPRDMAIRELEQRRKPVPPGCHGECGAKHLQPTRHRACPYDKDMSRDTPEQKQARSEMLDIFKRMERQD